MPAGLQLSLLYKIMGRSGELREESFDFLRNSDLYNLVSDYVQQNGEQKAQQLLNRHLVHLSDRGYVRLGPPTSEGFRAIWLTADGEMFLQPELAEFGQRPMLPQVVESIERRIAVLTYPEDEKNGMLYRLREAIAKRAPELIAKVIVEVSSKILTSGA